MDTPTDDAAPRIGPVATSLLFENDDVKVWQMNCPAGESFWHHYHHHDYVLFYTTDVVAIADHGDEQRQQLWQGRFDHGHSLDARPAGVLTRAQSVFFIPGTGFLSPGFHNVGATAFVAPLVEVVRPRRDAQHDLGFARSDALVGMAPRPGRVHLLENDRVCVYATTLAPGAADAPGPRLGAAVYVIDGGTITRHADGDDDDARSWPDHSGHWRPAAGNASIRNTGTTPYRELSVELK